MSGPELRLPVLGLYAGSIRPLAPEGRPSAIFKQAVAGRVRLTRSGLSGDAQADRRVHGGPDKALHQYAAEHYEVLAANFPGAATELVAGSLGENLATRGVTEETVCIGDRFRLGTALIQVSEPRSPCWKIDHRLGTAGLARLIAERGVVGWYYRVLEEGEVGIGDTLALLARNAAPVSVRRAWLARQAPRPSVAELEACAATPGLAANWRRKLEERLDWLRRNPGLDLRD